MKILEAFQWVLGTRRSQVENLVDEIKHRPDNVFEEYIFAHNALIAMVDED